MSAIASAAATAVDAPSASEYGSSYSDDGEWGAPLPPLEPGQSIGEGFDVIAHLRRGRRLDVYDAWSSERNCRCVVKTLRPERATDKRAVAHLVSEGWMLARLTHPHLVRAYQTITTVAPHRPAVVLETLSGHTLSYLIDHHDRLPAADIAVLGVQLCSVVGYLHRHRWLHLDVKPSNIVATQGRAVLLDLSVARRIGARRAGGTFDYLSPEQARGDRVTEAADVWGIGATLFETLAGDTPYSGWSHRERDPDGRRMYPQCEHPAPSLRTRSRAPRLLTDAIDACLQHDPAKRPTTAELSATLAAHVGLDPRMPGAASD